jgi:hypothetical protein
MTVLVIANETAAQHMNVQSIAFGPRAAPQTLRADFDAQGIKCKLSGCFLFRAAGAEKRRLWFTPHMSPAICNLAATSPRGIRSQSARPHRGKVHRRGGREAGGPGRFVCGHLLGDLQAAAVLEIGGDAGGAEGVAADLGLDPSRKRSFANHSPNVGLEQGIAG